MKTIIRVFLFFVIGICISIVSTNILLPKYVYPDLIEDDGYILRGLYGESKDSIDVIALGNSHMMFGFIPMTLYEDLNVKSYNLASSDQGLICSYYVLEEAFKTQSPNLVILDAAALIRYEADNDSEKQWEYLLTQMPLSKNKIRMAYDYMKLGDDSYETDAYENGLMVKKKIYKGERTSHSVSIIEEMVPLLRFHDRWSDLSAPDFSFWERTIRYQDKGYFCNTSIYADCDEEAMDYWLNELENVDNAYLTEIKNNIVTDQDSNSRLYYRYIQDYNKEWLLRIADLCNQHETSLLIVKIPDVNWPQYYFSSWTKDKSDIVREFCHENNLAYYDLLYDTDCGIDWATDTIDGGMHLNYRGAVKVTKEIEDYICENYIELLCPEKTLEWDKDLEKWGKVKDIAELQSTTIFENYLEYLNKKKSKFVILMSANDDMSLGLSKDDYALLNELGIGYDFSSMNYSDSFIAIINAGSAEYVGIANRENRYSTYIDGVNYIVVSSGNLSQSVSSILINGEEHSNNKRGVNIVVIEKEHGCIVDTVTFDTCANEKKCYRNQEAQTELLREFERMIINSR